MSEQTVIYACKLEGHSWQENEQFAGNMLHAPESYFIIPWRKADEENNNMGPALDDTVNNLYHSRVRHYKPMLQCVHIVQQNYLSNMQNLKVVLHV